MPLDVDPVQGGEWAVFERKLVPHKEHPELPAYRTHYATCTNPKRFRR